MLMLLIVLIVLLVGALPIWNHSTNWSYVPSGGLGLVLLVRVAMQSAFALCLWLTWAVALRPSSG